MKGVLLFVMAMLASLEYCNCYSASDKAVIIANWTTAISKSLSLSQLDDTRVFPPLVVRVWSDEFVEKLCANRLFLPTESMRQKADAKCSQYFGSKGKGGRIQYMCRESGRELHLSTVFKDRQIIPGFRFPWARTNCVDKRASLPAEQDLDCTKRLIEMANADLNRDRGITHTYADILWPSKAWYTRVFFSGGSRFLNSDKENVDSQSYLHSVCSIHKLPRTNCRYSRYGLNSPVIFFTVDQTRRTYHDAIQMCANHNGKILQYADYRYGFDCIREHVKTVAETGGSIPVAGNWVQYRTADVAFYTKSRVNQLGHSLLANQEKHFYMCRTDYSEQNWNQIARLVEHWTYHANPEKFLEAGHKYFSGLGNLNWGAD
ncbi:uncharacterized protein LOC135825924 [Sycon ciliatum]|uniref:uncharacterized protein LOC135825924 n=1 Tax=Sycon ciliatum TaxID=27933 RepID=UPI0031F6EAA5